MTMMTVMVNRNCDTMTMAAGVITMQWHSGGSITATAEVAVAAGMVAVTRQSQQGW